MHQRRLHAAVAAAVFSLWLGTAPRAALAGSHDQSVLDEINFARTHPAAYARRLEEEAQTERPDPAGATFAYEDSGALQEALDFLRQTRPLAPLRYDSRLAAAAQAHTAAQGPSGEEGHAGPRGETFGDRLQHHQVWAGLAAEDISYGYRTPADVVRQLIVDSGVPNRGHRNNIFGPAYQVAGVSCGPHRIYGSMCVIDFAGALARR
ncbi:CAP domain-containing protein [Phenylobacterium sp.]|jgi:uncharacterized protein YkwD|uniref:CAP domain-containing protein n=1 Tax=Phenylobacterium sp. TaxID=1871053 RepID=UPI001212C65A|nr:CAP domain-containing protein [Phenylobacterium sp.]THD67081.1 MAG: CAP domain-containing protein [Phenylobacterium sp.]